MPTITVSDVSLFTRVAGHGYPLVLMHGGPGADHSTLLPLRSCADTFTLVFYDHRCNGRIKPHEVVPCLLRFGRAYTYHPNLLTLLHEVVAGLCSKHRPETLIFGFGQLLKGWTVMERLSEIRTPTLVLAGRHDFQFPPEHQAALVDRIPNAQLAIIERAGHNAPMECTAEVIEIRLFRISHG